MCTVVGKRRQGLLTNLRRYKKLNETYCQSPINHAKELSLKHIEFANRDAAYFGVESIGTHDVAECFGR